MFQWTDTLSSTMEVCGPGQCAQFWDWMYNHNSKYKKDFLFLFSLTKRHKNALSSSQKCKGGIWFEWNPFKLEANLKLPQEHCTPATLWRWPQFTVKGLWTWEWKERVQTQCCKKKKKWELAQVPGPQLALANL